ncbi:hypothetical protein PV325_009542, partial [Microctonus aethiopoides]
QSGSTSFILKSNLSLGPSKLATEQQMVWEDSISESGLTKEYWKTTTNNPISNAK